MNKRHACARPSGHKQEVEQEAAAKGDASDAPFQYVLLLLGVGAAVDPLTLATRAFALVSFLRDL